NFLGVVSGYLIGEATQYLTDTKYTMSILYLVIYIIVNSVEDVGLYNTGSCMLELIESKVSRKLGYFTYKKAINLPAYAYEKTSSGEVINRIVNDADTLSFAFSRLVALISSLTASLIVLVYIFINSWVLGIEIIIFVGILYLVINKYDPMLINVHKERKKVQDKFTSLVNESIRGIREIKTLGVKNNLMSNMREIIKSIFDKSKEEVSIRKKYNALTFLLKIFLEGVVFITCAFLIYKGSITIGFFVTMTYYIYRFTNLIDNINNFSQTYQKLIVSLQRVNEILENRLYEDEIFGNEKINKVKGLIEFKNVSFSYPDEDNILNDFNIKLEPNKKIAIVGKSGQGKSTLFNLITRVFDVKEGLITLDDINIKDLTEEELRKHISIIRQEPFIFNRTILENFKIINKDIELEDIRKYTKMSYLDDYIMSLPNGYDTVLGEGGVNLSGGQKQRLSIARTLAKNSEVILFDEATSALDNSSQDYIKKTIDNLIKDHTVVIVAHRLSTIMDADIIYLVDKGKVVDSGTHNELLKTNKTYKNLYETESLNS
ncbi:MAG: ABC transporter ATP-binding protein, partial [Clostridium sp.]|nr:ABC transporter ATP-binding protein [Clostridium sp.]